MSSEQVRPIIECFCQILSLYGFSTITSDTFRLAKFDQNEATIPLWKLIFEMIHFDTNVTTQQVSRNKFAQIPKDEIVDMIKTDLYKRGYTYDHFLSLDNNMRKGSRQLLFCIGWLIYHLKLIEKCMRHCVKSILNHDQTEENQNVKSELQTKGSIRQIKQAMRSNTKLRFGLRHLQERVMGNDNVQEYQHWSSFEAQFCQHPHLLSQYLIDLENEHHRLSLFLFWNKHENIFWKWMESALDQPSTITENREIDCQRLEAEKQKFNAAIDTLDSALVRLEQLWISNYDHASIERDVSSTIASIDTQISSLFNQLLNTNSSLSIKSHSDQS